MRVLVVEDSPDDQELLRCELRKTDVGQSVVFLSDPRLALGLLQGPDAEALKSQLVAIFLDIHLPQMSGLDLLANIRATAGLEKLPIVVMTSSPSPQAVAACQTHKATALVEKPVTLGKFSTALANLFHQHTPAP